MLFDKNLDRSLLPRSIEEFKKNMRVTLVKGKRGKIGTKNGTKLKASFTRDITSRQEKDEKT